MLNHIPVLGIAFGLALVSLALLRKSEELKRISLGFLIVIALLASPAYLTGEPAEELVENLPGVSKILYRAARGSRTGGICRRLDCRSRGAGRTHFLPATQTSSKLAFGHCAGVVLDCFRLDGKDCEPRRVYTTRRDSPRLSTAEGQ
jgi:hypothetical protein